MSYSQLGQDIEVVKTYKEKQKGFFVEIGASDGISLSNTYLLESKYNWTGICVEPLPDRFEELCKNRPLSKCSNKAVFSESNTQVIFDIAHVNDMHSGISSYIDCYTQMVNLSKTQIAVTTITLTDLLDYYKAPKFIEYLSLDTEGSELEILKSFDFSKYTFGLIDVEHNYVEPRRSEIRNILTSNGYVYIKENQFDDSYRHTSVNSLI